jgi:hypothetical protein
MRQHPTVAEAPPQQEQLCHRLATQTKLHRQYKQPVETCAVVKREKDEQTADIGA